VKRENAIKTCFDSELAGMTSSHAIKSRADDVTELEVTSSRRYVENAEQMSLNDYQHHHHRHHHHHHPHHHHQQQQQPTSTQYISDSCVLLTYFTGDVESNVDQHFARALSQPSSFGPDYHGTTPPSLHTGMPTHSAILHDLYCLWLWKSRTNTPI